MIGKGLIIKNLSWVQAFILYCLIGRKVAIDASMCLYQFLIAVRSDGAQLTSSDGDTTRSVKITSFLFFTDIFSFSHLLGLFYRTIRILESGMKPVYVMSCWCVLRCQCL